MASIDEVQKFFQTPKGHTAKVIIVGATDKEHFKPFWEKEGLEDEMEDMDENASKLGMSYAPIFVVLNQSDKDKHIDAELIVPLQNFHAGLRIEKTILESKDIQRISDWSAGFLEIFCMNNSISALDILTGALLVGDSDGTQFKMDNVMRSIRGKKEKSELLGDAMDIGSVDEILGQQMSDKELKALSKKTPETKEKKVSLDRAENMIDIANNVKAITLSASTKKQADDVLKSVQETIMKKYGFKALEELLAKTGQPLLVKKPKKV